jgi:hypothetical protein
MIVRGALNLAGNESIQISTTFLILNRIQAILIPSLNVTKHRHYLQYISMLVFSLSFIVVFIICFQRAYSPKTVGGVG